jgi:branched-subunit amino acid permease
LPIIILFALGALFVGARLIADPKATGSSAWSEFMSIVSSLARGALIIILLGLFALMWTCANYRERYFYNQRAPVIEEFPARDFNEDE